MHQQPRLGPRRAVRVRFFDGQHEVLHTRHIVHMLDLDSDLLLLQLPGLLAQGVELAQVLENEPMDHPRLELWCAISHVKLRDYLMGGIL